MIWFIVLNTLMSDGTLYTEVRFPDSPQYNNEKSCNDAGKIMVDEEQIKIGTNAGTTYYICLMMTPDNIKNATGKFGSNS
jgi:hypothetical protein